MAMCNLTLPGTAGPVITQSVIAYFQFFSELVLYRVIVYSLPTLVEVTSQFVCEAR